MPRAERCERGGTKRLRTAEKIEMKSCRLPGDRKPCIDHSRFLSGTCEFSARLFNPLCDQCSTVGMTCRLAAPSERNLSVIIRFGAIPCFFRSRVNNRLAALVLRRV